MKVDDLTVEAAAVQSWKDVIDADESRPIDLIMKNLPELFDAHRQKVRAIFETDFSPHKSVVVMSSHRYTIRDLDPNGLKVHANLITYLQDWYNRTKG